MASIDTLDKTRVTLQANARALRSAIHCANETIGVLYEQKRLAELQFLTAKARYQQLKKLSNAICRDCWCRVQLLPALSSVKLSDLTQRRIEQGACIGCGIDMSLEKSIVCSNYSLSSSTAAIHTTAVQLPSSPKPFLDGCKYARIQSMKIINGDCIQFRPNIISKETSREDSSEDSTSNHAVPSEKSHEFPAFSRKVDYLSSIHQEKLQAKQQLEGIKDAMQLWSQNLELYETEFKRTRKALAKVVDKERLRLEARLLVLGVNTKYDKKRNDTSTNNNNNKGEKQICSVCWEPLTQNVAFQCGHYCCPDCATRLKKCHFCRKRIRQRIVLYDC
mmetsp:Transcript_22040/g.33305  ORF Transcript_22040/g.33305 Transcript_22040/m.33305 type:complete len:334 (-) Transcript_22040:93-1094(-)